MTEEYKELSQRIGGDPRNLEYVLAMLDEHCEQHNMAKQIDRLQKQWADEKTKKKTK